MDPLCRGLKEHALPVLGVDVVDHGLVVTAPKLLIKYSLDHSAIKCIFLLGPPDCSCKSWHLASSRGQGV